MAQKRDITKIAISLKSIQHFDQAKCIMSFHPQAQRQVQDVLFARILCNISFLCHIWAIFAKKAPDGRGSSISKTKEEYPLWFSARGDGLITRLARIHRV